ncbi:MAG TPA: hypothetical protein VFV33_03930 [Gemmatimonadaceae bacterium]|nr:hypothetical protein [Gemmatimonadaceae bacterium]
MNRPAVWAAGVFALGLALGVLSSGGHATGAPDAGEDAWNVPDAAQQPRHDPTAFAEAFAGLRWPSDASAGGDAPTGGLAGWRLLGIVSTGEVPHALLLPAGGGPVKRVARGDALPGDITVEQIRRTQVILRDARRCTLTLGMPARQDAPVLCPP